MFPRGRRATGDSATTVTTVSKNGTKTRSKATASATAPASDLQNDALFGVAAKARKRESSSGASSSSSSKVAGGKRAKKGKLASELDALVAVGADSVMDSTELVEATGGLLRLANAPGRTKGKIEHIVVPAFKQIEPGMMMLGIVKRVTRRQLFVALPYGLSGLVSVREVADVLLFNDRIQDDDEIDDEDNDEKSDDDAESDEEDEDEDEDNEKETPNGHARKKRRQSGGNSGAAAACGYALLG